MASEAKDKMLKDFEPSELHKKSNWANNPKILSEIVTYINEEIYIEDENLEMEKIDLVLTWIKKKYLV